MSKHEERIEELGRKIDKLVKQRRKKKIGVFYLMNSIVQLCNESYRDVTHGQPVPVIPTTTEKKKHD